LTYERGSILRTDGISIRAKGVIGLVDDLASLFVAAVDGAVDTIVDSRRLPRLAYIFQTGLRTVAEHAIIAVGVFSTVRACIYITVWRNVCIGDVTGVRVTSTSDRE